MNVWINWKKKIDIELYFPSKIDYVLPPLHISSSITKYVHYYNEPGVNESFGSLGKKSIWKNK